MTFELLILDYIITVDDDELIAVSYTHLDVYKRQGYGNSIKRVIEQKAKNPGLLGVVSDLIQVDKRYEIAIETALSLSLIHI